MCDPKTNSNYCNCLAADLPFVLCNGQDVQSDSQPENENTRWSWDYSSCGACSIQHDLRTGYILFQWQAKLTAFVKLLSSPASLSWKSSLSISRLSCKKNNQQQRAVCLPLLLTLVLTLDDFSFTCSFLDGNQGQNWLRLTQVLYRTPTPDSTSLAAAAIAQHLTCTTVAPGYHNDADI